MTRVLAVSLNLAVALVLLAAPVQVRAQPGGEGEAQEGPVSEAREQARELGRQARSAYDQGRYLEAAELLGRADELFPAAQISYNLARCLHKAARLEEAAAQYDIYLERSPRARDRRAVEQLLRKLRRELAAVGVEVQLQTTPPGALVRLDGTRHRLCLATPCTLRLSPGRYRLELELAGHRPLQQPLTVERGRPVRLERELEPELPPPGLLRVNTPVAGLTVRADGQELGTTPGPAEGWSLAPGLHRVELLHPRYQPHEEAVLVEPGTPVEISPRLKLLEEPGGGAPGTKGSKRQKKGRSGRSVWPWVAFGTAAASAATGTVLGLQTYNQAGQVLTEQEITEMQQRAAMANVLYGVAGVGVAVGFMLYLLETPSEAEEEDEAGLAGAGEPAVLLGLEPRGTGVSLILRF